MKSFCAASQLKVLVERPGCPKVLEKCVPILHKCFPNSKIGTLMHDIHTLDQEEHAKKVKVKEVDLEEDVHCAFELYTKEKQPKRVNQYARYDINGRGFAMENTTPRNSIIFYQPPNQQILVPAVIRQIFSPVSKGGQIFIAVHRYREVEDSTFKSYTDFGAGIWSQERNLQVEIVPVTQKIYAANRRQWADNKVVLRPLIEVHRFLSI